MDYIFECDIDTLVRFSSRVKIGIFYKDISWRNFVHQQLLEYFTKLDDVYNAHLGRDNAGIWLKNGTTYDFVRPDDTARGYKFNCVYIQDGIDLNDDKVCGRIYASIVNKIDLYKVVE